MDRRRASRFDGAVDTRHAIPPKLDQILMTSASSTPFAEPPLRGSLLALDDQGFPAWAGEPLELPPKERAVLALLIQLRPQVVSKQLFADKIWGELSMSDESLARCISRIRHMLAPLAGLQEGVESIYATGYRLKARPVPAPALPLLLTVHHDVPPQDPPELAEACKHARQLAQRRTPAALSTALRLLRQLVARYPQYGAARVALAETMAGAAGWGLQPDASFIDEGLRQLEEAERMGHPGAGVASARAYLLDVAWRFDEAAVAWEAALRLSLDDPDAVFLHGRHLLVTGNAAAAVGRLREALRLHPYSALLRTTLARALTHAGDAQAALVEATATCDDHPDSEIAASYRIGLLAFSQPQPAVVAMAWKMAEQRDASSLSLSIVSYALARLGMRDEALSVIDASLVCVSTTACVAVLHAAALVALGETARAIGLLARACEVRCGVLPMVLRDPANAPLRGMPQVERIMQQVFGPAGR